MYFTLFGFNGIQQGQWLLRDLKLAQLAHLSPRSTFAAQMIGTIVGSVFDYIMMLSIVKNQFDILTSAEGSNIWSGQNVQMFNTLAVAYVFSVLSFLFIILRDMGLTTGCRWSMAGKMFSVGARYQWVTLAYLLGFFVPLPFWFLYRKTKHPFFEYINLSIILWYAGWLFVGINASIGTETLMV